MPKVHTVEKARTSPGYCKTCKVLILAGEPYHHWSFRFGGKHVTCGKHTPRQSQLTQSKLSQAYAAIEDAFDQVCKWGIPAEGEKFVYKPEGESGSEVGRVTALAGHLPSETNIPDAEDLKSILEDCKGVLEEVAQEYRDAAEAAPNFAEQSEARADVLENSASELENAEFEGFEEWLESNPIERLGDPDAGGIPTEEELAEKVDEWISAQREIAEDALNNAEVEG